MRLHLDAELSISTYSGYTGQRNQANERGRGETDENKGEEGGERETSGDTISVIGGKGSNVPVPKMSLNEGGGTEVR